MNTVKFLNFRTPTNFTVNTLTFKLRGSVMVRYLKEDANRIAHSEDPDQTAPLGAVRAVRSGTAVFALGYPPKKLRIITVHCMY